MASYPKSPTHLTSGMMGFGRMVEKIRLHERGELGPDYHANLGRKGRLDGACCDFLRVKYADLRERVLRGGSDEEILEWCFENGRRLNAGDLMVWNGFVSKLGWRDFAKPMLDEAKRDMGISERADITTIPDMIDFDEHRKT